MYQFLWPVDDEIGVHTASVKRCPNKVGGVAM